MLVALLGSLSLVGCGPRSDRLEVTGEVSLNGTPLEDGTIRFSSQSGKEMASGAMIDRGEYKIPQEKGLTPGTYRIEITAPDNNAKPVVLRDPSGLPGIPTAPERIPPEYNVKSTQSIEVTPDGDNHFVFDIVTKPAK